MGTLKKEKNRLKAQTSSASKDRLLKPLKGENFYRDAKAVKRANLLKSGNPIRDKDGKIKKAAAFQSTVASGTMGRIQPDRRWFGNTRVIGQQQLENFREAIQAKINNPFEMLLQRNKLPMSLLQTDSQINVKQVKMNLLQTESFGDTFGSGRKRKRPKLKADNLAELADNAEKSFEKYDETADISLQVNQERVMNDPSDESRQWYEKAGQSRRIWNELYKVIDSSDVIIHVLDARNPEGTRCRAVEKYIRNEAAHKHLIFVLNKCDLVPTWVTV